MAGVGKLGGKVLGRSAALVDIGNEHVWKLVKGRVIAGTTGNLNRRAVHVELRGSRHLGEPSPGKSSLSVGNALREFIGVVVGFAINTRAAALNRLDDLELRVHGRLGIQGDTELAGAASVDSGALELDGLLLSNSHLVHLRDSEPILRLARVLGFGNGTVVNLINTVWNRLFHDDVAAGSGKQGGRSQNGGSDRHDAEDDDDIVQR